eukprot:CCRYP_020566-RA/>CCRYP_020566-RA protein AED:0.18 eAED:0.65 QI:0/0/0/0.75/0.33/0.25/4/0/768
MIWCMEFGGICCLILAIASKRSLVPICSSGRREYEPSKTASPDGRKKELKKNKTTRIAARDAKVAATRSVDEIQAEISALERRRDRFGKGGHDGDDGGGGNDDTKGGLDSIQIKKLERLRKELKIVQAESSKRAELAAQQRIEEEKARLASMRTLEGVKALNESKYSLAERYASVYYDPVMNPYGVPPPGQPKLFYGRDGGTTMDLGQAVVPERWRDKMEDHDEQDTGDRKRKRLWDDAGGKQMQQDLTGNNQVITDPAPVEPMQQFPPPPPPPPPPPAAFPAPPHSSTTSPAAAAVATSTPILFSPAPSSSSHSAATTATAHSEINSLPPSPITSRLACIEKIKSKVLADIWASQEEMEYDETLDGIADYTQQQAQANEPYLPRWQRNKLKKKEKNDATDKYDPCCPSSDGYAVYRNREQIERQAVENRNRQKEQTDKRHQPLEEAHAPTHSEQYDPQTPTWYYRDNSSGAIQGPFPGVQMHAWKSAGFFPETTPVRRGKEGKFVSLGEIDFMAIPPPPPPPTAPCEGGDQEEQGLMNQGESGMSKEGTEDSFAMKEAGVDQPKEEESVSEEQYAPNHSLETMVAEPPPSDDENDDAEDNTEYAHADGREVDDRPEVDMCLPPPSDDEDGYDEVKEDPSAYYPPPGDEENVAHVPYPIDVEYPIPSDDAVPYPVDVEYPIEHSYAYPDTDEAYGAYEVPAVAPYPGAEITQTLDEQEQIGTKPPPMEIRKKKKYDGDKIVVSFVPSTVKRKGAASDKVKKSNLEEEK